MTILDETMGAYLIGVVVASVMYGCTLVQTWYYYTHYPLDPWYIKFLVASIFVSDTTHQALITHLVYTYLVTYFGNLEMLNTVISSVIIEVFFNALTALVVQCFLAMRIYRLSNKNLLVTGLALALISLAWTIIMVFIGKAVHLKTYPELATINNIAMWNAAAASAADVFITVSLCYLLQTSRTGMRRTDVTINKLILFSINTGLLTSLCAILALITIVVVPQMFVCVAFYFSNGRLYCNSLLATLNARKGIRGGDSRHETLSLSHVSQHKTNHSVLGTTPKRAPNNISIKIDTTEEYMRDEQYSSSSAEIKNPEVV